MGTLSIRYICFLSDVVGYYVSMQLDEQVSRTEGMVIGFIVAHQHHPDGAPFPACGTQVIIGGILGFIIGLTSANIIAAPLKLYPLGAEHREFPVLLMMRSRNMGVTIGIRKESGSTSANIRNF